MDKNSKIYIAGHGGMAGAALLRKANELGYGNIITRSHSELDLLNQSGVNFFFKAEKPDVVILAAAKVGGIAANFHYPADFIYQNLMIQSNVIHAAYINGVKRMLFLGSSCIYPKVADQPVPESALLTAPLESTNEPYAVAKIAGIKTCESYNRQFGVDYRSVMPASLYGPGDNFHPVQSHVIPGLLRRIHEAKVSNSKQAIVWGSGHPKREFMHIDDMASACWHVLELDKSVYQASTEAMQSHINIGTGLDISINQLAEKICNVTNYGGKLIFDSTRPDGVLRKLLNVDKLYSTGWSFKIHLDDGLKSTYSWFLKHQDNLRGK